MADVDTYREDRVDQVDNKSGAYATEHTLGWLMALTALALGAIGLLVGFGVIGGSEQGVNLDDVAGAGGAGASNWLQGALWLLPAISMALLSRALHGADHHQVGLDGEESHDSMFNTEHAGAYLAAAVTVGAAALAPLVGFDVFDRGNAAEDGLIWGIASIVPAVVTGTLHAVRHHQQAAVTTTVARRTNAQAGTVAPGPR